MGYGKSKESANQERKNLLDINPIPDHASGSFMSKHSSSNSAFHQQGNVKKPQEKSYWEKTKENVGKFLNHPHWSGARLKQGGLAKK
tara:strand:+ start:429 stop:689 length:261 start_codon:yes stop_codon:yes gene_type:complete